MSRAKITLDDTYEAAVNMMTPEAQQSFLASIGELRIHETGTPSFDLPSAKQLATLLQGIYQRAEEQVIRRPEYLLYYLLAEVQPDNHVAIQKAIARIDAGMLKPELRPPDTFVFKNGKTWVRLGDNVEKMLKLRDISRLYVVPDMPTNNSLVRIAFSSADPRRRAFELEEGMLILAADTRTQPEEIQSQFKRELAVTLRHIIEANPELQNLQYDPANAEHVGHLIRGIATGFNPRDLQFYIDGGGKDEAYSLRKQELEARILNLMPGYVPYAYDPYIDEGMLIQWRPCPDTMDIIERHIAVLERVGRRGGECETSI